MTASVTWSVALAVALGALTGCEVERVKFSRLVEGKKFLAAADPFQAAVYFQEALVKDKDQTPAVEAHLVVAADRAARKVAEIPVERRKYETLRDEHLAVILRDAAALSHLVAILEYHDLSSQSAERMLVGFGAAAAPALLEAYRLKPAERLMILRVLGEIGVPALPAMRDAIRSDELIAIEQVALVRLIGGMKDEGSIAFLTEVRNEATAPGVRAEAAAAVYRLGRKGERNFLVQTLDSPDVLARRAASNAMVHIEDKPDQSVVIRNLRDADADVRLGLVRIMGEYPSTPEAIHALIGVIRQDDSTDVANAAVGSLARYGPTVIEPLLDAFAIETDWPRRQRMIRTLGDERVIVGFDMDQEFRLYELYEKRARSPQVKGDMAHLLELLDEK